MGEYVIINILNDQIVRIFESFDAACQSMQYNGWTSESHIIRKIVPMKGARNKIRGEVTITFKIVEG